MTDNQGTVRDVVDATGVVVNHITYDSFGGVTGESNTAVDFRFGYTGREFDEETGLYYYRARYYDAATGRFISQDPIGFEAGDGNLYRYVFNSPTNFNDYSGEAVIALTATVGGGLLLGAGILLILSNPQAQEVIPQLPQRISNLFKFSDTTPNPDFDSNNINRGKTPDFLPDPLVGGGFRLGIHDFNPNDINIHDGVPLRVPNILTFPLGDFDCLFPSFFTSDGIYDESQGFSTVNKPDPAADVLANKLGGYARVKFNSDPEQREFDAISDKYIAQAKPGLQNFGKKERIQAKKTFEAASQTGREVYYEFETQPSQKVINQLREYEQRYGVKLTIDIKNQ